MTALAGDIGHMTSLGLVSPTGLAQWLFRRLLLNYPLFQLLLFLSLQLSILNITGIPLNAVLGPVQ